MDKINLSESLKKLEEIADWFDNQQDLDVETGIEKVKAGVALIKQSRERLKEVENEFNDIKRDLESDLEK